MTEDTDTPRYEEGEDVVYQLSPASHVDDADLDEDGMLRYTGTIVETPGHDGTFAGKRVRRERKYKIERKPGVHGIVTEERIVGYAGEVPGGAS